MLLKNPRVKEEIKGEVTPYFEVKGKNHTAR